MTQIFEQAQSRDEPMITTPPVGSWRQHLTATDAELKKLHVGGHDPLSCRASAGNPRRARVNTGGEPTPAVVRRWA